MSDTPINSRNPQTVEEIDASIKKAISENPPQRVSTTKGYLKYNYPEIRNKYRKEGGNGCKYISLDGIKGGVGKTTLTVSFAVGFANAGLKVAVVDMDLAPAPSLNAIKDRNEDIKEEILENRNAGNTNYVSKRKPVTPILFKGSHKELAAIIKYAEENLDLVIFDGGGFASDKSIMVGSFVDLILLPLGVSKHDLLTTFSLDKEIDFINENRKRFSTPNVKAGIFFNRMMTANNSQSNQAAQEYLEDRNEESGRYIKINGAIKQYEAFIGSSWLAEGVTELAPPESRPYRQMKMFMKSVAKVINLNYSGA